jgi:Ni/Fe-hydrogenase 1 B-type cytochrome subunit
VLIGVLLLAQALTGFALYTPAQSVPGLGGLLGAFTSALGGLMAVRMWHYFLLWAFLAIVLVHVYLSVAEDRVQLPLMFAWRETEATEEEPAEEPGLAETA